MQDLINNLNNRLFVSDNRYDIIDYIHEVNKLHKDPIDLSFMEKLLEFVDQDQPCIPHTLLVTYGVLSNTNVSANVKLLLEQYDFTEENGDYLLLNVQEQVPSGTKYIKKYLLHPRTFKYCLMRAKNTKTYAKYYLLLEECVKYYHNFQLIHKDYLLKQKDDKIDTLISEIKGIKEQNIVLMAQNTDLNNKVDDLLELSVEEAEQRELLSVQLKTVIVDRINDPNDSSKIEQMVVLKYNDLTNTYYYVIRGTVSYVKTKYKILTKQPYHTKQTVTEYIFVREYCNVPNARHLFRALSNNRNIISSGNKFEITGITENEALDLIQEVFDKRLTVEIERQDMQDARNKANKRVRHRKK